MAKKASKSKMVWVYAPTATAAQKLAISKEFEPIIEALKKNLKPLPEPQEYNHCIDVFSKWRGNHFSIMQKFKTGGNSYIDHFETGLARLEYYGEGNLTSLTSVIQGNGLQYMKICPPKMLKKPF